MFRLSGILFLLIVAAGLAVPGSALAAPPPNDAFAAAEELSGRLTTASGLNKEATKEAGEPDHAGKAGGASVWYRWTAPASGQATVSTCESTFDTLLAAYTGDSFATLQEKASNDDSCGIQSSVSFPAAEGVTYRFAVDGLNGATGAFTLKLRLAPVNDNFADGVGLTGDEGSVDGTTVGATAEPNEPNDPYSSVWYRWTAPSNGWASFDTCASSDYAGLVAFTGSALATLMPVPVRYDYDYESCEFGSRIYFEAAAGESYKLAVYGYEAVSGFTLTWNRSAPRPEAVDYPTITGAAREGQTLAASEGTWLEPTPFSFAYAWGRCDATFDSCNLISGATSRTYTLSGGDVGYYVYLRVTATNAGGSTDVYAGPTNRVRPSGPTNTSVPELSGETHVGEVLFATAGAWTGLQPIEYTYQWQECDGSGNACLDLPGENAAVIEMRAEHVDSRLRVVVTARNPDGARSAVSSPSSVVERAVAPPPPVRCVVPNVRGKRLAAARKAITKAHCRVGRIQKKFSNRVVAGRVISQSPKPKARLASRGRVNLVVSKGRRR
jgi:PASTA domain